MIIEIATTDFESTKNAVEGGADRIELCANLGEGGTTQSFGVIKKCRDRFDTQIFPIIRVRGGDFLYTDEEFDCMLYDALKCKELECDGIVIGFLKRDGGIDVERTERLVEAVYPLQVTFHRAFDRCKDPFAALEDIISCGCSRILTSGQQPTAPEGASLIGELNKMAKGRIIIMPGSGVRSTNILQLAKDTGCGEFHTSLRKMVASKMHYVSPAFKDDAESYEHSSINPDDVRALRKALEGA
ncbi:MAG: copper homeostasis protein CutC [Niabella sp.]